MKQENFSFRWQILLVRKSKFGGGSSELKVKNSNNDGLQIMAEVLSLSLNLKTCLQMEANEEQSTPATSLVDNTAYTKLMHL